MNGNPRNWLPFLPSRTGWMRLPSESGQREDWTVGPRTAYCVGQRVTFHVNESTPLARQPHTRPDPPPQGERRGCRSGPQKAPLDTLRRPNHPITPPTSRRPLRTPPSFSQTTNRPRLRHYPARSQASPCSRSNPASPAGFPTKEQPSPMGTPKSPGIMTFPSRDSQSTSSQSPALPITRAGDSPSLSTGSPLSHGWESH